MIASFHEIFVKVHRFFSLQATNPVDKTLSLVNSCQTIIEVAKSYRGKKLKN